MYLLSQNKDAYFRWETTLNWWYLASIFDLTSSMTPSGNIEKMYFYWKILYFQFTKIIFLSNCYRKIMFCIALPSIWFIPFTTQKFILEQLDGWYSWSHIITTVFKKKSKGSVSENSAWMFGGIAGFSLEHKEKGVHVDYL